MTSDWRGFLSRVPEITVFFWIIKIIGTPVGGRLADSLSDTFGAGLTLTTVAMTLALLVALFFQFRAQRYVPGLYWLVVVLIGIVATLITDNLGDNLGVPLPVTASVFAVALAGTFAAWYRSERSLSLHTIDTHRRETFYWIAVFFAFALGTAGGNFATEKLGLGGVATSVVLLAVIVAVVTYLAVSRKDAPALNGTGK
jgi:uncharacterized membrane-anchored protein